MVYICREISDRKSWFRSLVFSRFPPHLISARIAKTVRKTMVLVVLKIEFARKEFAGLFVHKHKRANE